MGYTHYWYRERSIQRGAFAKIVNDFKEDQGVQGPQRRLYCLGWLTDEVH